MSDRFSSYPPDEPVIGETYPTRYDGEDDSQDEWDEDAEYDDDPAYDEEGYGYYDGQPQRQPMFYVFIGLAVILGAAFVVLLFGVVQRNNNNTNDGTPGGIITQPKVDAKIRVDAPLANDRIEIGKVTDVLVSANATEGIANFELYVDDKVVDRVPGGAPDLEKVYHPRLKATFTQKGEHQLFVRLLTVSGAKQDSDKVLIVAIEPVADKPLSIKGKVLTLTSIRATPADTGAVTGNAREGQEVTISGRTRDNEWLFIDVDKGGWVKRNAIEAFDALSIVPVKDASPTPGSATPGASTSPTSVVTTTPTPQNTPDLTPSTAQLFDGGSGLRISVVNLSTVAYEGPLEVSVTGLTTGTLTKAFAVKIPSGGASTVDFELDPPVTTAKTAQIRVDPGNAIKETSEDNNSISVSLTPPAEPADIVITAQAAAGSGITVTIKNNGGPLASSNVTVRVRVGNAEASQSQNIALARGQTANFGPIAKPASGQATIEVLVNGGVVASSTLNIP